MLSSVPHLPHLKFPTHLQSISACYRILQFNKPIWVDLFGDGSYKLPLACTPYNLLLWGSCNHLCCQNLKIIYCADLWLTGRRFGTEVRAFNFRQSSPSLMLDTTHTCVAWDCWFSTVLWNLQRREKEKPILYFDLMWHSL